MSLEDDKRRYHNPADTFGLTGKERLYSRVSDKRFQAILTDPTTVIHQVAVDNNLFGEYLFITLSRMDGEQRSALTFYGLGYHDEREQWVTEVWHWYVSQSLSRATQHQISLAEAQQQIQARREEIAPFMTEYNPSRRALLFALIADLTDEDGAVTEMEDLERLGYADLLWGESDSKVDDEEEDHDQ